MARLLHSLAAPASRKGRPLTIAVALLIAAPRVTHAQSAPASGDPDCSMYQFAKYGPMDEATFRQFYPTMSTAGMVCNIVQRGVTFALTPEFERYVNTPFPQPDVVAALRAHGPHTVARRGAPPPMAATASVPLGVYTCARTSMRGTYTPFGETRILAGGRYESNGAVGRFTYDAATRRITWLGGVNAHAGWTGQYYPPGIDGMDVPTFEVRPTNGPAISCKFRDR